MSCSQLFDDGHEWQPSGMRLMREVRMDDGLGNTRTMMVGGSSPAQGAAPTPEVDVCQNCGALRIDPKKWFLQST